eukprot:TRINITY_DN1761_c0_g1_i8.p2 TRINITY_DN1761_c0_g1~~TRINITY_DN1761_c0_g1_i8.p2  ORF type:complete len:248 (-),score=19.59 TRINITY_DN1761_c0_g1_i8:38-781(-)
MNKQFAEFHFSTNYLTCMQYSIMSVYSDKVKDDKYLSEEQLLYQKSHYLAMLDMLQEFEINHVNTFYLSDDLDADQQDKFQSLFNDDICTFPKFSNSFHCELAEIQDNFQFGLLGGLFHQLKYLNEIQPFIEAPLSMTQEDFDSIYNTQAITSHITALQVLEMQIITISNTLNEINSEIMSRLFVQLEFLFILGGGMTTIVLMILLVNQNMHISSTLLKLKRLLLIVPSFKWQDQTTLNLIKQIDKQ